MPFPQNQLENRLLGCLAGLAAGDALGQPCRGRSWKAVSEDIGPIQSFLPWKEAGPQSPERPAGSCGDLAALALGLAERIGNERRKPRSSALIDELIARPSLQSLPAQAALARIRAGIEPSRSAVPELTGPEGLYLAVPIGAAYMGNPEGAFLAARSVVGPILLGPSLEAGQTLAAAVAAALGPEARASDCFEAALDLAPPSVAKVLDPAALFAREHLGHPPAYLLPALSTLLSPRASADAHGPVLESLAVALTMLQVADGQPELSVNSSAAYGGSAHSGAAVAGALAGAIAGIMGLPVAWLEATTQHLETDIYGAASRLAEVVAADASSQEVRARHIRRLASESAG